MITARVDKPDYELNGRRCAVGEIVRVSRDEYLRSGPRGRGVLAFISDKPEDDTPAAGVAYGAAQEPETGDADTNDVPTMSATDAAFDLAVREGIDLTAIEGSGTDGKVLVGDVRREIAERDGE